MEESLTSMFDRATELMEADQEFDALELVQEIWSIADPAAEVFARATRILALVGMEHVAALMPDQPDGNELEYREALEQHRPVFDAMLELPHWPRPGLN